MNDIAERPFAVLRTRLPYIDRRALSQAWYGAMHAASDAPQPTPARRRTDNATGAARSDRRPAVSLPHGRAVSGLSRERLAVSDRRTIAYAEFARTLFDRTALAARATAHERARSYPPFRTSLTLGIEGERVQLMLRREGTTLHVVAVCTRANAALVRRALACADAHLRARGENVRASVRHAGERA